MRYRLFSFVTAASLCAAPVVVSHPHIFVDTKLRLIVDEAGALTAVDVTWMYDPLYSFLVIEDMKLDPDGDGQLTDAEQAKLIGFDMNWIEGFEGDLYVTFDGAAAGLGGPEPLSTDYADGILSSTHRRSLTAAVPADGVLVQAYDPGYYTAYSVIGEVPAGETCMAEVIPADLDRAYASLEELLFAQPQSVLEDQFPEVGKSFADQVQVTCAR